MTAATARLIFAAYHVFETLLSSLFPRNTPATLSDCPKRLHLFTHCIMPGRLLNPRHRQYKASHRILDLVIFCFPQVLPRAQANFCQETPPTAVSPTHKRVRRSLVESNSFRVVRIQALGKLNRSIRACSTFYLRFHWYRRAVASN